MEENKIIKEYRKEDITVVWQPHLCIHSKKCWKELVTVFDPRKKPWIELNGATNDQIKHQIQQCPSKALSYKQNNL
jgi:uncharacterized Fe-S cluster protein YjdI